LPSQMRQPVLRRRKGNVVLRRKRGAEKKTGSTIYT